jgi:hypothetical protein
MAAAEAAPKEPAEDAKPDRITIDATHLKVHRTAASLLQKGAFPAASAERRAA